MHCAFYTCQKSYARALRGEEEAEVRVRVDFPVRDRGDHLREVRQPVRREVGVLQRDPGPVLDLGTQRVVYFSSFPSVSCRGITSFPSFSCRGAVGPIWVSMHALTAPFSAMTVYSAILARELAREDET